TFETVLAFEKWPYGQKPVFVLSTGALAPSPPGAVVECMSGPPADIVSKLAARGFTHVYVDGGLTIQRFLEAGLIDRLTIARVPAARGPWKPIPSHLPWVTSLSSWLGSPAGLRTPCANPRSTSGPLRSTASKQPRRFFGSSIPTSAPRRRPWQRPRTGTTLCP